MDLRMPTGEPGVVGTPLDLDPIALDTSGDGYLDNETVDISYRIFSEDNQTKLTAQVTTARSHPARIDTTGDGLTDAEQLEGWEIAYTASREETFAFLEEIDEAEIIDDLDDDLLETKTVYANPLVSDSSGDGLPDVEERLLGTDPETTDTTGDGIPDVESQRSDYDPTLFEIDPPEIDILYGYPVKPSLSFDGVYHVGFVVEDAAGLERAAIVRDGDVDESYALSGVDQASRFAEIDIGALDTLGDLFRGATVTVEAEDRNENEAEALAHEQSNVWGEISDQLREAGFSHAELEYRLGLLSGMTTGAGETAGGLYALYEDPLGTIAALQEIVGVIANIDEVIAALPEQVKQQQQLNNPHDPDEDGELYETYREGWYGGYIAWFVVELVVPAGEAGKAVKGSERVQSAADTLNTPKIRQAAQYAGRAKHTAAAPVRYSRHQLSRGLSASIGVTQEVGENVLSRVPTSGQQFLVGKVLHRTNVDAGDINRQDADGQATTGENVARSADDAARVMADGGTDAVPLLARSDHLDTATKGWLIRAYDRETIDADDIRRIAQGLDEGDIDQAAVQQALVRANNLEANGHSVQRVRTAKDVNSEYGPGYQDPYASRTMVVEYVTESAEQFVRVHGTDNQARAWMMKRHQIEGLAPGEIQQKFSLPETPTYVSDVDVPKQTPVRTGVVEENFGGQRGATQFELREHIDAENFHNQRELPI